MHWKPGKNLRLVGKRVSVQPHCAMGSSLPRLSSDVKLMAFILWYDPRKIYYSDRWRGATKSGGGWQLSGRRCTAEKSNEQAFYEGAVPLAAPIWHNMWKRKPGRVCACGWTGMSSVMGLEEVEDTGRTQDAETVSSELTTTGGTGFFPMVFIERMHTTWLDFKGFFLATV